MNDRFVYKQTQEEPDMWGGLLGSVFGGVLGAVGGGALGSLIPGLGTIAGVGVGKTLGAGLGSGLGGALGGAGGQAASTALGGSPGPRTEIDVYETARRRRAEGQQARIGALRQYVQSRLGSA